MKHTCHNCGFFLFLSFYCIYSRPNPADLRIKTSIDMIKKDDLFSKAQSKRVQEAKSDVEVDILKIEGMETRPGEIIHYSIPLLILRL